MSDLNRILSADTPLTLSGVPSGFLPLLLAPLVPYQTVGVFISAILVLAGVSTLFLLPAIMAVMQGIFFPQKKLAPLKERSA